MPAAASVSSAFGEVMRELRQERGLSQEMLGFECARHRTYVSGLERGNSSPTLDTLWLVADALGVSPTEFVRRIESRKPLVPADPPSPRRRRRKHTT